MYKYHHVDQTEMIRPITPKAAQKERKAASKAAKTATALDMKKDTAGRNILYHSVSFL